ncbi:hypothetical protein LCGC14_2763830 [marine sediment metagenome]|uniref:Uncharacterized protein n=1 Tax=marine sediment metagenome TaxID=412755 RepID=A0A0F9BPU3_9ZZZZ
MTDWGIGLKDICRDCGRVGKDWADWDVCMAERTSKPYLTNEHCSWHTKFD